jgi:betaine-homocysteine S-methyltransferase
MGKGTILERLAAGPVIGDGGFVFSLEKRGYVKAGPWTPEASIEHPAAVQQLHREFLRAGADVMQAFTFYASDDKLANRGNYASAKLTCAGINEASCKIAREVASEGDALVAGGLSQTPSYLSGAGKAAVQAEFKKQLDEFVKNKVDFIICEYFEHIEEMEWAIEESLKTGLTVGATMCIGPEGDMYGNSTGECGVRMAKAGASIVGVHCHFEPMILLDAMQMIKDALAKEGLSPYLMVQPLAYLTPDASKQGFIDLPEFPFSLEPRVLTRWEMHAYARRAWEMGVRFIGGCCGFEPYHIRALSEELEAERGFLPEGSQKHGMWGAELRMHTKPWVRARASKKYWEELKPASGRPFSASLSKSDNWGITAGHKHLKQQKETTADAEVAELQAFPTSG